MKVIASNTQSEKGERWRSRESLQAAGICYGIPRPR
jgi:hypothetical protein